MPDVLEKYIKKLFAPIIVFDGFEDIVTAKIIIRVMMERLSNLLSETATDYEAMVYLHTSSLVALYLRNGEIFTSVSSLNIIQKRQRR